MKEKIFKKGFQKRLLSFLLSLAMVISLMPMTNLAVYAASDTYHQVTGTNGQVLVPVNSTVKDALVANTSLRLKFIEKNGVACTPVNVDGHNAGAITSALMKIDSAYKYYDNTYYDVYIKLTDIVGAGTWEAGIWDPAMGGVIHIKPTTSNSGYVSYNYEVWLIEAGKSNTIDNRATFPFVGGSCFMAGQGGNPPEYCRPWSTDDHIYITNNTGNDSIKYISAKDAWSPSGAGNLNRIDVIIFGEGTSAEHSIKGGYAADAGSSRNGEMIFGYVLNAATITFKDENGNSKGTSSNIPDGQISSSIPASLKVEGKHITGWTADQSVTLNDGTSIPAGSPISNGQLEKIISYSNLVLKVSGYADHTYGTTGDARFTCTACSHVDETRKAAAEAADNALDESQYAAYIVPYTLNADGSAANTDRPTTGNYTYYVQGNPSAPSTLPYNGVKDETHGELRYYYKTVGAAIEAAKAGKTNANYKSTSNPSGAIVEGIGTNDTLNPDLGKYTDTVVLLKNADRVYNLGKATYGNWANPAATKYGIGKGIILDLNGKEITDCLSAGYIPDDQVLVVKNGTMNHFDDESNTGYLTGTIIYSDLCVKPDKDIWAAKHSFIFLSGTYSLKFGSGENPKTVEPRGGDYEKHPDTLGVAIDYGNCHVIPINNGIYKFRVVKGALTYSISLNVNVSDGSVKKDGVSYSGETLANVKYVDNTSLPVLSRVGYTFKGWNTNSAGSGTNYTASAKELTNNHGSTVTLYAKWEPCTHTYGTTGSDRYTCSSCSYVDLTKKEAAEAADTLAVAKETAKAAIDAEVDGDTTPEVLAAADEAKAAIDAATNLDAVSDAELEGIAKIAELRHLNVLEEVKKAAKAEIDSEVGTDTSESVKAAADAAKAAIDAATTVAEVEVAADNGIDAIEAAKVANRLAAAKAAAKAAIDTAVGTDSSESVRAAANAAKAAIDAATTLDAIETAKNAGVTAVDTAKVTNAANALAAAKAAAKAAIDAEVDGDTTPEVVAAADEAKAAIDAATSLTAVSDAEMEGIAKIAELRHLNVLDEVKKAAKAEIDSEVGTNTAANVLAAAEAAKAAIDAATTVAEVEAATDNGINAIEAAKSEGTPAPTLEELKATAKAAIDAAMGSDPSDEVKAAAEAAKAAIDEATTEEAVTAAKNAGVAAIVAAKGDDTPEPEPAPAPEPDMTTTNIGGLAYNTWEDIVINTPRLTVEKLHEVNFANDDLLHVNIYGKIDKMIPVEAIDSLKKSPIRGLHVYIGEGDAVTFLNELDYTNYATMSFRHEDVIEDNRRVIDFTTKGKINATVMFHTLITPNVSAKVYKVIDGKEVEIATLSSNADGGFCFLIDELSTYVIKY